MLWNSAYSHEVHLHKNACKPEPPSYVRIFLSKIKHVFLTTSISLHMFINCFFSDLPRNAIYVSTCILHEGNAGKSVHIFSTYFYLSIIFLYMTIVFYFTPHSYCSFTDVKRLIEGSGLSNMSTGINGYVCDGRETFKHTFKKNRP